MQPPPGPWHPPVQSSAQSRNCKCGTALSLCGLVHGGGVAGAPLDICTQLMKMCANTLVPQSMAHQKNGRSPPRADHGALARTPRQRCPCPGQSLGLRAVKLISRMATGVAQNRTTFPSLITDPTAAGLSGREHVSMLRTSSSSDGRGPKLKTRA